MANINVTARVVPNFPAKVQGSGGVDVNKTNGVYTISLDLDQFSNQEGSILYRGPTGWQGLLRGQDGQVLKSTSASIEWGTSSADQTFVGVDPIDVNTVGSTTTTSYNPDFYSANQGAIQKRGATAWEGLDKGTAGQVLTVNGTGTDIEWATPGSAGGSRNIVWCGTAGGTANDIVLTPVGDAITSYDPETLYAFIPSASNTDVMTVNISGVGITNMVLNNNPVLGGMVRPPVVHYLQYDNVPTTPIFHTFAASTRSVTWLQAITFGSLITGPKEGAIYYDNSTDLPWFRTENTGTLYPLYTPKDSYFRDESVTEVTITSGTFVTTGLSITFTPQVTGNIQLIARMPYFLVGSDGALTATARVRLTRLSPGSVVQEVELENRASTSSGGCHLKGVLNMGDIITGLPVGTPVTYELQGLLTVGDRLDVMNNGYKGIINVVEFNS